MTDVIDGEDDLNARLKAAGMFTIPQMMDDEVSGLGPFDTHPGVNTFERVCEWVDRKRLEYTRMRARQELDKTKEVNELYEWTLAHSAAFTCISKHLRQVKSTQAATIASQQARIDELEILLMPFSILKEKTEGVYKEYARGCSEEAGLNSVGTTLSDQRAIDSQIHENGFQYMADHIAGSFSYDDYISLMKSCAAARTALKAKP